MTDKYQDPVNRQESIDPEEGIDSKLHYTMSDGTYVIVERRSEDEEVWYSSRWSTELNLQQLMNKVIEQEETQADTVEWIWVTVTLKDGSLLENLEALEYLLDLPKIPALPVSPEPSISSFSAVGVAKATPPSDKRSSESVLIDPDDGEVLSESSMHESGASPEVRQVSGDFQNWGFLWTQDTGQDGTVVRECSVISTDANIIEDFLRATLPDGAAGCLDNYHIADEIYGN